MSDKANAEVVPERPRSHLRLPRPGKWTWIVLAVVAGTVLATAGGAAYATYSYTRDYTGRILPGATIAGVEVGGLTRDEAAAAVAARVEPRLTRTITVTWKDRSWDVTPAQLGARARVDAVVARAMRASASTSFVERARMRLLDETLDFSAGVPIRYSRRQALAFVEDLAGRLDRDVVDASLDYSTGWVEISPERTGREVKVRASHRALMTALRAGGSTAELTVKEKRPEVTTEAFDKVLLLRIGENKLYLYEDGKIAETWTVATGQPEYPTPTGLYSIELKRYMPTWINPDPDGWGADMPAMIPPGPGNPLGTRALNWTAPAIRFHGTSATYSLGYNASHGCVRMAMSDVEYLYDIVDVGTPIVSVDVGGYRPLYASAPDPIPIPGDESGAPDN